MELIIEILSGKRAGQKIALQKATDFQNDTSMPYLLETDAFALHLKLKEPCTEIILLMDDTDYPFFYKGVENNLFHYSLMPKSRSYNSYESLFYNYFGIASIEIKVVLDNEVQIIPFRSIDVLARKLTADQAAYMVEYILKESEGDLYSCFSATRLNANYNDGGEQPKIILTEQPPAKAGGFV